MNNDLNKNNNSILEPYEGFLKGNIFKNLYNPYKNYTPAKLIPNSEKAELLLNVNQLCFISHELNLYLDLFPNDKEMIMLFDKYNKMTNEAKEKYEKKYSPLFVSNVETGSSFSWEEDNWPWEDK